MPGQIHSCESYLVRLNEAIEQHRDIKQTLREILPAYHESE